MTKQSWINLPEEKFLTISFDEFVKNHTKEDHMGFDLVGVTVQPRQSQFEAPPGTIAIVAPILMPFECQGMTSYVFMATAVIPRK